MDEATHTPAYLDATRWLLMIEVKIDTVDPNALVDFATSVRPFIKIVTTKTHIFDDNVPKQSILEYELQKLLKQHEWEKNSDKKTIMTLIYGQCDKATLNELSFGATYKANHNNGNLMSFLD